MRSSLPIPSLMAQVENYIGFYFVFLGRGMFYTFIGCLCLNPSRDVVFVLCGKLAFPCLLLFPFVPCSPCHLFSLWEFCS